MRTREVATVLYNHFPENMIHLFIGKIHRSFKPKSQSSQKRIPRYKFRSDQHKMELLLAFISLFYYKYQRRISTSCLDQINSATGYSITRNGIRKWYKKIKIHDTVFFKEYMKYKTENFPLMFREHVLGKLSELNDFSITNQERILIEKKLLELIDQYQQLTCIKALDNKAYILIALAYRLITNKRGIPFDFPQNRLRYISQCRSKLQKRLN